MPSSATAISRLRARDPRLDADPSAALGEFHRVRQKVEQDLTAGAFVGYDFAFGTGRRDVELDVGLLRLESEHVAAGFYQRRHGERLGRNLEQPRLEPRGVEQQVDDGEQVLGRRMDDARVFDAPFRRNRQGRSVAQNVGKAEDGVERRAQLVADVGEQPVFERNGRGCIPLDGLSAALRSLCTW